MTMVDWSVTIFNYVCPAMGVVMASAMFAAPVQDLRMALIKGKLAPLNPFPWAMQSGNCLGWIVYGYYTRDPFVVFGNVPGFIVSIWLNFGASKLQYLELREERRDQDSHAEREQWDASPNMVDVQEEVPDMGVRGIDNEGLVLVPQETALLRILSAWAVVLAYAGWFTAKANAANIIGVVVNANLIFFYGAPLQTVQTVVRECNSESIHLPTLFMNFTNTSFWIAYGLARMDPVIIFPNAIGLSLGVLQGILCIMYPAKGQDFVADLEPLSLVDEESSEQRPGNEIN